MRGVEKFYVETLIVNKLKGDPEDLKKWNPKRIKEQRVAWPHGGHWDGGSVSK